jgi:dTDP-4-dehydrorhamnose 3,5-epimerase
MQFIPTELSGVILIEPDVYRDERGFFLETYHAQRYAAGGVTANFVQDNHSYSVQDTLRGLHIQHQRPQGKLVRVLSGEIFDVAVDICPGSPTFRRWVGVVLSAENFRQLYVPPGYAHGFLVLSNDAQVAYKCSDFYHPGGETSIRWDDPDIGINWPSTSPLLSAKDAAALSLHEYLARGSNT